MRASRSRCSSGVQTRSQALVQLHHGRRRHLDQRRIHPRRDRKGAMPELDRTRRSGVLELLRRASTEVAIELAQAIVRDGEGATKFVTVRVEGGKTEDECRQVALRDRAFAAGEDGVLRFRPEPRPHPRRDRLRRHRRSRRREPRSLPRRGARGDRTAGATRPIARKRASAAMAKPRVRRARASCIAGARRDGLDLRSVARLREHQRRIPHLSSRQCGSRRQRCAQPSGRSR